MDYLTKEWVDYFISVIPTGLKDKGVFLCSKETKPKLERLLVDTNYKVVTNNNYKDDKIVFTKGSL